MNVCTDITGVILCGGKSSRMGTDKALLKINNNTWLEQMRNILYESGCNKILVSGEPKYCKARDLLFVQDIIKDKGPLAGIYSCLIKFKTDLLVVPVDTPLLKPKLVKQLINCKTNTQSASITFKHQPLPCLIKYSQKVKDTLEGIILSNDGSKSILTFLNQIGRLELNTNQQIINFNTKNDLQMLHTA